MREVDKKALEYVRNTAGGATLANFIEDWEPIGRQMWKDVFDQGFVMIDDARKIRLTILGERALAHATHHTS